MWNLKYDTNELIYKHKQTHIEKRLVVAVTGRDSGGGIDWEFGVTKCKLLHIDITESLCYTPGTNTTLCINYTSVNFFLN